MIQSSVSFASRKRKTNWHLLLPCTDIKETRDARDEKPTWCLPAPFCIQLWCIRRGTKLSEKPANLPCLNELQHFQAYIFHWLEWLNSQSAVYHCFGTGNQFSNAVWACSLELWSSRHQADTHIHTAMPTDIVDVALCTSRPTPHITQMAIIKAEDSSKILTYQV